MQRWCRLSEVASWMVSGWALWSFYMGGWVLVHPCRFTGWLWGLGSWQQCKGAEWLIMWLVCMNLQYPRYDCTNHMFLLVDNSDSPSVLEQSQQRHGSSCYTLLAVIPSSMKCFMPYACQLASCSMCISCCDSCLCVLMFPMFFSSATLSGVLFTSPGALQPPFYSGYFLIEPWDSLFDHVHPGIACVAFLDLQLERFILG